MDKELKELLEELKSIALSGKVNTDEITRTGFFDLDSMCLIKPGDLIFLGSRTGMGKSSLALNIATNVSLKEKIPVFYYSLKQKKDNILLSIVCSEAEISSYHMSANSLAPEMWEQIIKTISRLINLELSIIDNTVLSISDIRNKISKFRGNLTRPDEQNILIVIDDLQTLSHQSEYVETCRQLKILAKEINVSIILTCQLDPWLEKRNNKRPRISDLDYQGNISNYADKIWLLFRDEYYNENSERRKVAELTIAKNKNNPIGLIELYFDASLKKFVGMEPYS